MDCKLACERLEASRPDARDREDPDLLEAFEHLDQCPVCAETVDFRRMFDRRLRTVIRAVEVPADLQSRLLAALPAEDLPRVRDEAAPSPPSRRRGFLTAVAATVATIAVGGLWWAAQSPPEPLTAETVLDWCRTNLTQSAGDTSATLAAFQDDFEPTIGDGRWESQLADKIPRGADLDGDGKQDVAVYRLRVGYLVVLPPNRVTVPPSAGSARSADPRYLPAPHVAWTVGGQMHVCILPGGTRSQLDALLELVHSRAA